MMFIAFKTANSSIKWKISFYCLVLGVSCQEPNGITKVDKEAIKSDEPLKKCVTDITEIKAKEGKLYKSVLGIAIEKNKKADLCVHMLENVLTTYPCLKGAIIYSDRGNQYTSEKYRKVVAKYGIVQSINSAGGRCHDNACCEKHVDKNEKCTFICSL